MGFQNQQKSIALPTCKSGLNYSFKVGFSALSGRLIRPAFIFLPRRKDAYPPP